MFFLKNICFLCLCDDQKNLKNMCHLDENNISLQCKLEYCMNELMNIHFEIPKLVCATCQQFLNFVYTFKQKCIQNNIRLKKYIDQLKPNEPLYDDKYQNLLVCVSDTKPLEKLKLEKIDHLQEKVEFNNEKRSIKYVPLQDCEFSDELFLNTDKIIIKEEFEIFDEQIDYQDTIIADETDPDILISQACQNMFEDEIKELDDKDNRNNNKQTKLILTSDSQNIVFEIDSSILNSETNILSEEDEEDFLGYEIPDLANQNEDSQQKIKCFDVYKIKKDDITSKYHCSFCDKKYSKSTKLDIHLRKYHIEDKPFYCQVCPAKFQFRSKYKSHLITHDDVYACHICDKKFSRKYQLTLHLKLHAEKAYQCKICLKKFRRKYHYTNHMTIHTGEKAFECPDCGKKFSTTFNLAAHSRVHTGARPYVCSICGKTFKDWVHRRSHMDSHSGYKRYACNVCPGRFTHESNLRDHMRVHSDERPFVCTICSKGYKKRWHLSEHVKTHAKSGVRVLEKVKCEVCEKICAKGAAMKKHMKVHETNVVK